tara:strand:+ start:4881 stop:5303 length:423 start_codon:yes stop_codon:yes gene_type:complete
MYIINDIENLVLLNDMRVFPRLRASCGEICITNIRVDDFSISYQKKIEAVISQGLDVVEVEVEYYNYCEVHRARLIELGDGDKSSIYHALKSEDVIITGNSLIREIAKELAIKTIGIEDFVQSHIKDIMTIDMFNQLKIA